MKKKSKRRVDDEGRASEPQRSSRRLFYFFLFRLRLLLFFVFLLHFILVSRLDHIVCLFHFFPYKNMTKWSPTKSLLSAGCIRAQRSILYTSRFTSCHAFFLVCHLGEVHDPPVLCRLTVEHLNSYREKDEHTSSL